MVLHFREDLVDMDAATENDRRSYDNVYIKDMYLDIYPDGMAGNARAASKEHGRHAMTGPPHDGTAPFNSSKQMLEAL